MRSLWATALAGNTGGVVDLLAQLYAEASKVTMLCVCLMLLLKQVWGSLHVETVSLSRLIADMWVGDALRETVVS